MEHLHLRKDEIVFAAFGGWDAYGAKRFGYSTYWVKRLHLLIEDLSVHADRISNDMQGLVDFILH